MDAVTILRGASRLQSKAHRAAYTGMLFLLLTLPGVAQAQFSYTINSGGVTIKGYNGPGGAVTIPPTIESLPVTSIEGAFYTCWNVTSVSMPNSVTNIGSFTFYLCTNLTSLTISENLISIGGWAFTACRLTSFAIPKTVRSIGAGAFNDCASLTAITVDTDNPVYSSADGVLFYGNQTFLVQCPGGKEGAYTIPSSVTSIFPMGFFCCKRLASVTVPNGVTYVGQDAFSHCFSLAGLYCTGNAPSLGGLPLFALTTNVVVYYLSGTTGWGPTFGDRPTAVWIPQAPSIQIPPRTQTAEIGSAVGLRVEASGALPLFYLWYRNQTNFLSCSTNCALVLTNVQVAQSGAYTVVISNSPVAVTSAWATLNVIAAVDHRSVPGVTVTGEAGSLWNLDYTDSIGSVPNWTSLGSVSLTTTSQYYFDLTLPLPPQRFYRAWQVGSSGVLPALDLHRIPALTLTGSIGNSVRVDCINRIGPTDAWLPLDTVRLTNTSQFYFDTSAWGQPERLYRLTPLP